MTAITNQAVWFNLEMEYLKDATRTIRILSHSASTNQAEIKLNKSEMSVSSVFYARTGQNLPFCFQIKSHHRKGKLCLIKKEEIEINRYREKPV